MPQGVSYFLCCKTGHCKKTPEFSLCLSMCQRKRQRKREKEISWTDDLKAPHDHLLLVIHKASLTLSTFSYLPYTRARAHTQDHRRSRADIQGGVIPGVESLRSPCCDPVILGRGRVLDACRERKRLYIKNTFLPEAVSLHLHGYRDVHI